jgi:signal transduction histidine kinase
MNDFVHNAGHELKTPLSVIDSNIQLIKESKIYDEKMINELKDEI